MKTKLLLSTLLLTTLTTARGSTQDYVLKTQRLDNFHVAITCENGADPTGVKASNILIITCLGEGR